MKKIKILIKQVRSADNESLAKMIRDVFEEYGAPKHGTVYSDPTTDHLYELFQTPKSILWVAVKNSLVVGCCGIFPTTGLNEGCAELVKFYLSKETRGKGIGRELMQICIRSAKEFGYKKLYLESFPQFSKALGIYVKQGFTKLNGPMGNSGHTACSIWMIREL